MCFCPRTAQRACSAASIKPYVHNKLQPNPGLFLQSLALRVRNGGHSGCNSYLKNHRVPPIIVMSLEDFVVQVEYFWKNDVVLFLAALAEVHVFLQKK